MAPSSSRKPGVVCDLPDVTIEIEEATCVPAVERLVRMPCDRGFRLRGSGLDGIDPGRGVNVVRQKMPPNPSAPASSTPESAVSLSRPHRTIPMVPAWKIEGLLDLLAVPSQPLVELACSTEVTNTEGHEAQPLLHCGLLVDAGPNVSRARVRVWASPADRSTSGAVTVILRTRPRGRPLSPRHVTSEVSAAPTRESVLATVRAEDAGAFAELVEPYRRELRVHCYRMLASYEDAQDLVQETFLRAWRRRETFEGRAPLRAWLYRIATNACLDFLDRRPERAHLSLPDDAGQGEVPWLQPAPDRMLAATPDQQEPGAVAVTRETIELAFLVAVQHLPPRQRAVLILRDVLGWPAKDAASLLEITVASANSALQRARTTMRTHLPAARLDWTSTAEPSRREQVLVQRYMEATDHTDVDALKALFHEELRFAMPPEPGVWLGRDACVQAWVDGGFGSPEFGEFRTRATSANFQPAVANYIRQPGDRHFRLFAVDVLTIRDGRITEVIAFGGDALEPFDLPPVLADTDRRGNQ
jgi:RNA polymerase sigma-70 factor (TIGR02960 family)